VPVLAALRRIHGSPWVLVAKVDQSEVFGPARRKVWMLEGALLGLVALAALSLGLFVRQQEAGQIQARLLLEREKHLASERYAGLMEQASDIILVLDARGRILEANAQAVAQYGLSLEALRTRSITDLRAPETLGDVSEPFAKALACQTVRFETAHRRADGTTFPVEVSSRGVQGGAAILSVIRDITERRAQERELRRMTRLYAALSQVNQAIVWSRDRQALLDRICEVMTGFGGFRMAWIGWLDPATRRLDVAARHGDQRGMLDRIVVRADDSLEGQGAMGQAIREQKPCVINDFLGDPASLAWRDEMAASGFAAIAAFPVRQGGEVQGAFAVYAGEPGFFGRQEVALLEEAALDISFALDHLAGEARRREAEAALQESERFLQRAQEAGGAGTYAWLIQEDTWRGSPYLDRIFGVDASYPRNLESWSRLVAPEHRADMDAYVAGIIARREPFDHVYPIIRPADGARRWLHGRGEFQWDADGRLLALTGIIQDITERRRAEEALRASEEKFAKAFHASPDSVNINRLPDGVYLAINEGFTLMTGYTEAEVLGRSSLAGDLNVWVRSEDRDRLRDGLQRSGKVVGLEAPFRRKDGSVLTGLMSASLIEVDGEPAVLSIVRDITTIREQGRELERLTRMYAALSQVNQAIVWCSDRQALLDKICQVMVEFGTFSLAWIGRRDPATGATGVLARCGDDHGFLDGIHIGGGARMLGQGPEGTALREGRSCILNDIQAAPEAGPWHEAAGRFGYAASAAIPIRKDGAVWGVLTVCSAETGFFGAPAIALLEEAAGDIAFALDHLEGEQRRRDAEAARSRLLYILESSLNEIYVFDPATLRFLYVNQSAQQNLGRAGEALRDLRTIDLATGYTEASFRKLLEPLERGERSQVTFETEHQRTDGSRYPAEVHLRLVERGGERYYLAIVMDLTERQAAEAERRDLEAQLHQAQKLESMGSLAGGVAHDMNNVLGGILSLASTLRAKAEPGDPDIRTLETIQNACLRGRGVVKSLLYFARKDLQEEVSIDLNALAKEITQLLSHTTLKRVQLEMDLQEPLGRLRGDAGALSHALMNLCVNSLDAMPGGGTLRIQTAAEPGGGILVRVADTGEGMAPDVLLRATEPFFTTKPQGKGTGLGLSMVYGTLKAHEGRFELRSAPGKGTEALLHFPASRVEPLKAPTDADAQTGPVLVEGLRILLVDDDELIREALGDLLAVMGHTALPASGGREGLDLLDAGQPVDLVILDMNMPEMNGVETLERILALRPDLPVLMATGYSDADIAPLLARHPNVSSILKPFSTKELNRKLGELCLQQALGPRG
jgi:PAS domain S-box-containing protein